MGTLFSQSDRNYKRISTADVISFISDVQDISKETKLSVEQVLKAYEILEQSRQNDLYAANGDIHDEQMAGIGELIQGLSSSIDYLGKKNQVKK